MEITGTRYDHLQWVRFYVCTLLLTLLPTLPLLAQAPVKKYFIKNGQMCIEVSKQISEASLDSFVAQYNLTDLDLKHYIKTSVPDSLLKLGWIVAANNASHILICKPLQAVENLDNPAERCSLWREPLSQQGTLCHGGLCGNVLFARSRKSQPCAAGRQLYQLAI